MGFFIIKTFFLELLFYYNKVVIFVETLKQKEMIELVLGGFIYWIITKIEEERKIKKRLKDAKEKVFPQDYPQYYTSL